MKRVELLSYLHEIGEKQRHYILKDDLILSIYYKHKRRGKQTGLEQLAVRLRELAREGILYKQRRGNKTYYKINRHKLYIALAKLKRRGSTKS